MRYRTTFLFLTVAALAASTAAAASYELLNVSYDPTRELYRAINTAFSQHYKAKTGSDVTVRQSHGGSGTQARAVIDGLEADVVTLALWGDTKQIAKDGLMAKDWETRLPNNSLPDTSTIIFVGRKGERWRREAASRSFGGPAVFSDGPRVASRSGPMR